MSYGGHERGPRQWIAAVTSSSAIYVAIAVLALTIGTATKEVIREQAIDVTFVEKVVIGPPPPPPPPEPIVEPPPKPAAAAPVIRPDQKIRKLDKPPPVKELVAPKEMPTAPAKEVDASLEKGIAVYGDGPGDPAGLEGGQTGGVAGGVVGGAIALPENAIPPVPAAANAKPRYPETARATGKQGTVILKVFILATGTVADVQLMRGDEPFASEAIETVRRWTYEPAKYRGQPITVYRIIRIPFKLTV